MLPKLFSIFILILFLSACSITTDREKTISAPIEAVEKSLSETDSSLISTENASIPFKWWEIFEDQQLNQLIEKGLTNNPSFQASQKQILYASSIAAQARSTLFPMINYGADVARQKFSKTGIIPFPSESSEGSPFLPQGAGIPLVATGGVDKIPVYFTQYETELSLVYELDLWSKNRNRLRAAIGEIKASIADHLFARLELSVAIAQTYFQLQIDYQHQKILKDLVEVRQASNDLTQKRVQGSLNDLLTLKLTETNYSQSLEKLLSLELDITLRKNQLKAYISGDFKEEIEHLEISTQNLPKVPIPKNLPLHLLSRRPDITSQLWLIDSAGKWIEVAKAGFYPDVNIFALYGYQTIHFPKLLSWPSSFFNIDPALTLPIFDGGRLQANLSQSEVNYDLAILKYNELVIDAVKEVLDGLAELQNSDKQLKIFETIVNDQRELLTLTSLRVQNNISSGLDELIRKDNLLEAEEQQIVILGKRIHAIISLIKSLGGGYETCVAEETE